MRFRFNVRDLTSRDYLFKLAVVFASYFVGGKLGLSVPFTDWNVSPMWPPAGIALAAVLVWGFRVWPAIALGAFCVNFFSPIPHAAAFGLAIGNTSSALLAGYLLIKVPGFDRSLLRLRDILALAGLGAAASTVAAATIGTTTLYLNGVRPWSAFSSSWLMWWAGDGIGVLLFAPLVLTTIAQLREHSKPNRVVEGIVLMLGALLVCGLIFDERVISRTADHVLAFALFPFVLWAAIRFGVFGTSIVGSGLALIAVWETENGRGPFVQHARLANAGLLQGFLALISLTGMILAAVVREREAAEDALAREQQLLLERDRAETERKLAEEALVRSEKLAVAGRFAATIAHEINNPLSAVTNLVYLLGASSLPQPSRQLVVALAAEVDRVAQVVKQTLSFYRETTSPVRLRLTDIVEELLRLYVGRFQEQDVFVEKRLCTDSEVEAYPVEMRQVFSNLLLNALEASGDQGHITIEVSDKPNGWVQTTICDDGPGIPEEIQDRIFEPFFSTKSGKGVGLGLWITHGIIERHGGRIEVTSKTDADSHGTRFTVVLPKRFRKPAAASEPGQIAS